MPATRKIQLINREGPVNSELYKNVAVDHEPGDCRLKTGLETGVLEVS